MTLRPTLRLVALTLSVAACAPMVSPSPSATAGPTPTPAAPASPRVSPDPSQDEAAIYRSIAAQVVQIRGLAPTGSVEPTVIDRTTLQQNLATEFDKDNPTAEIARTEAIEKALGLLPAGSSLRDLYVKLQGSQVIGYYDPTAKKLFIVSHDGGLGPTERLTYAHEFTHELQDQHFDLNGLGLDKLHDDSDRALAILSLVEGDAVGVQAEWMATNLTPAELAQVAAEASDQDMLAILASMPPILLETSLFPYQAGATFDAYLRASGANGNGAFAPVNAAFGKPPTTTEQIIHPEKYVAGEGAIAVTLPDNLAVRFGAGWTERATDTFGELQTRVWLKQGGVPGDVARTAAAGWGGDRMILASSPDGASSILVYASEWDTAADADAFRAAATVALTGLQLDGSIEQAGSRVIIGIRAGSAPSGATLAAILRGLATPTG